MKKAVLASLLILPVLAFAGPASAEGWAAYKAEKFGFSMLIPEGTTFGEKELPGGWGALVAKMAPLTLRAIGKLGEPATPDEIQAFGVRFTKVAADHWKTIGEGKDSKGWKWYRTV